MSPAETTAALPQDLKAVFLQTLEDMAGRIWAAALEEARKQVTAEQADWADERQRISLAFANAELGHQEQVSILRAQLEALQAENAALKAQLEG